MKLNSAWPLAKYSSSLGIFLDLIPSRVDIFPGSKQHRDFKCRQNISTGIYFEGENIFETQKILQSS